VEDEAMRPAIDLTQGHWDKRIYPGVDVRAVARETRDQLAQALGTLGVEAEHVLSIVAPFLRRGPGAPATRAAGDRLLWQLESSGQRLIHAADDLEMATQAYLGGLEADAPDLRPAVSRDGTWEADLGPAWWPPIDTSEVGEGPIELNLRQCDYAYRHVVAAHLATNVAGIAEQMALLLHALRTLPPVGVMPLANLYAGLYQLSEALQGHMVPHHLRDVSPEVPGLLTGITLLRHLDATEDRSIEADLAWAHAQLAQIQTVAARQPASGSVAADAGRRGLLGLFRRKPTPGSAASATSSAAAFVSLARHEWTEMIQTLESLRRPAGTADWR
jgi:hypothetical protein